MAGKLRDRYSARGDFGRSRARADLRSAFVVGLGLVLASGRSRESKLARELDQAVKGGGVKDHKYLTAIAGKLGLRIRKGAGSHTYLVDDDDVLLRDDENECVVRR